MWLSQVELLSPKQTLVSRKQAKRDPGARPRLDLTQSAEPVRGDSDARARGSTQRKQHLDEDPLRARSPRVTEVSSTASRSLARLCAFNTTRAVDSLPYTIFECALRSLLRMRVLRALRRVRTESGLPFDSRSLPDSATDTRCIQEKLRYIQVHSNIQKTYERGAGMIMLKK